MKVGYIYKITSPTKKIYIGQTLDVKKRTNKYKKENCKGQPRLYNSIKKYGWERHIFSVIVECDQIDLNKWERYYQELYSCLGEKGLNCKFTGYNDRLTEHSAETRKKMSESAKNKIITEEHRQKIREANAKQRGVKRPKWVCEKISKGQKGIKRAKLSLEARLRMSIMRKGRNAGVPQPLSVVEARYKLVFNKETGIYYQNVREAAESIGIKYSSLTCKLNGSARNNTSLSYAFDAKNYEEPTKQDLFDKMLSRNRILLDVNTGIFYYSVKEAADALGLKRPTLTAMLSGRNKNKTNIIATRPAEHNRYTKDKNLITSNREHEYIARKFKVKLKDVKEISKLINSNCRADIYNALASVHAKPTVAE